VTAIEHELGLLRDELTWPATPDLAALVTERIVAEPGGRAAAGAAGGAGPGTASPGAAPGGAGGRGATPGNASPGVGPHDAGGRGATPGAHAGPRRLGWPLRGPRGLAARRPALLAAAALAAVLAVAATLAAAPGVRARVEHWLGIGAVRVERVERLPATGPGRELGLGRHTTLAGARRVARVRVPAVAALGPPDAVYADPRDGGASLVWRARAGLPAAGNGVGALLTVLPGGDVQLVKKLLGAGTSVTAVDVGGGLGVFIAGAPHVVVPPNRLAGNTLLWVRGETTYRLETALGRRAALRLARSVR
jgi:hypothetical protein